jgi:hypothetical protein
MVGIRLVVKSSDPAIKDQRKRAAQRVIDHLRGRLPEYKLLCFLDDEDWVGFKRDLGEANRALYAPLRQNTFRYDRTPWPDYMTQYIFVDDGTSASFPRVFDHAIYLHGSTCLDETGLTMSLAHELEHVIQHRNVPRLWAVNGLIQYLPRQVAILRLRPWREIPIEHEARIMAKRAAEDLCGEQTVRNYISKRIWQAINLDDRQDWEFVRTLTRSSTIDVERETESLLARMQPFRPQLEQLYKEALANDPDSELRHVDLNSFGSWH